MALISGPVMTLWKGVYHQKIERFIESFSICSAPSDSHDWYSDSWPCKVPLRVSPRVPVALAVGWLVLH